MAFDSPAKNSLPVTKVVYFVLILIIVSLIVAHFRFMETFHYVNRLTDQDYDRSTTSIQVMHMDRSKGLCDRSHFRYDICLINGSTVLDPTDATVYSIGPNISSEKIRPYPRKWEKFMELIREVTIKSGPEVPKCKVYHNSPAVIFSSGGLIGNFYHAFTDGFLPLYLTLNNLNLTDRDVILVVEQAHDWWADKYADIIRSFTKHPIINIEKETSTHCFTRVIVGLVTHGIMVVDPKASPQPLTISSFHSFLGSAFNKELHSPNHLNSKTSRPKLVWVYRSTPVGRSILNQDKARAVAEEVGFDVVIYKPSNTFPLRNAYKLIKQSHALIGAHGAGLTHLMFLRPGAVVVQIAPLGLQWVGDQCFGGVSRELGMEYMEYKLTYNESTLSSKYEENDPILRDSREFLLEKGWILDIMNIYLIEQNMVLDLVRFRSYMEEVHVKAKHFMELHG